MCYEGFIEMYPTGQLGQKTFTSICKTFDPDTDEQICGWDISEDGQLDQNELGCLISAMYDRARIKDRHGDNDPDERAKEIIKKLDINHDKKISKEEFIQGYV
ncbi:unnamed protein product [Adineta ricciae]|uniref:EF-hand domain-containing protein n=1 Tax=Adineta ricciae TaxID=249248 RepID=A0A814EUG1_ADIRI|nr:unnamed protein product [Adineta ricciae]